MTSTEKPLYRFVDTLNRGWLVANEDGTEYRCFDPSALGDDRMLTWSRADIEREAGPIRPVEPYTDQDYNQMVTAFDQAGRKLIGSVASALEQVHSEARDRAGNGSWRNDTSKTANYAQRALIAGRPGSWESNVIMEVVWFGNELNLHPHKQSLSVEHMRSTGPNPKRVDLEARDAIADVLRSWTNSPDRYVEVAENLAGLVSIFADEHHGEDGWKKIADQWLQPDARLRSDGFGPCYTLLYSVSAHFDPGLL